MTAFVFTFVIAVWRAKRVNLRIMKTITFQLRNSVNWLHIRFAFLLIALACFALSPQARATCRHGCLPVQNTVLGNDALLNNTTGIDNTAIGFNALLNNTTGVDNTAVGFNALLNMIDGINNTGIGFNALSNSVNGFFNTAVGSQALLSNTSGAQNTAIGSAALQNNTTGNFNTATGVALESNTTGFGNTATGVFTLKANTTGSYNTAIGYRALNANTIGSGNIALGNDAGLNLVNGSNNIYIGNRGDRESNTMRIGKDQTATFIAGISGVTVAGGVGVIVDSNGQLGTVVSSARFKEEIKPMESASEAILGLKPVTFRYKKDLDPAGVTQFGLVAEDVEKVNPNLVARDKQGKPYTVRYEAVNAMLLNEFLKEHRKNEVQEATIARQQKQIDALTAGLQKVSAQLELDQRAPKTVSNNH